jgi:hypothetical protein
MWGIKIYCIVNQKILHLTDGNMYKYFNLHQISEHTISQN